MEFEFLIDDTVHKISLEKKGSIFVASEGEKTFEADIHIISPNTLSIIVDGCSHRVCFAKDKEKRFIFIEGQEFVAREPLETREDYRRGEDKSREDELNVKAPMPGKVIKINVSEQQEVRKNQTVAIVEAMKMENEIKSPVEGYVKKIHVSPGDLVDSEKPILELGKKE